MRLQIGATQSDTQMDTSDLEKAQRDLRALGNEMPHVAVRALNKTMTGTKTDAKQIIRQEYNIKSGALEKRMSMSKANRANLSGYLQSKGGLVSLTDIAGTRQLKTVGVRVNVRKSTGPQDIPRAFIAPGRYSGKLVVLRRPGQPRGQTENLYPRYGPPGSAGKVGSQATLDAFYGPHPESLYNAPHNWAKIQRAAGKRLDTNITREIDAEFRRQEGKW